MKPLGIVRRIDHLGRITIPMEVRRVHGWDTGTPIEMFATDKGLVLREYGAEQKKLAIIEELKYLADTVTDETALAMIEDIMEYVKGETKS
ncbi:putative AbrB-like transcriptional regulator [Geobacillus virus E2]|jgi:bifunctional DNA-binding transcriptional regulator/antitoxin component of YhaV-PrlF toxin-antitoxin module|uniref:antitoxin from a toxin-antitoxin system n=1 Tax=Geobacillus virus E2 TaxID=447909 RepID=UPI00015367F4|nr:antitoxin from a toxin-antitoxin system [Geobacillus virus E2]ABI36850.1 putative AbrB-like transcriptional regulator [Geobacillus virus E2]